MKRLIVCLLMAAGLAQAANATDAFRVLVSTQQLAFSGSLLGASSQYTERGFARVSCSATCWVTTSATNVDTKYAKPASALLNANEIIYLPVAVSHYVLFRGQGGVGQGWTTLLEFTR